MDKFIVGVDLGGTNIKISIFDVNFNKLMELRKATEANRGPSYVLTKIGDMVNNMLMNLNIKEDSVYCMGMGIPGLLDPKEGKSYFSPNFPGWENIEVVKEMNKRFSFPIFIDNDVRVNLYGEWKFGAGVGVNNLVLITLGTGVGSGIVMDGRVLYGATASAGEIGHMNMYREGRPCKCGSSGCYSRYVSAVGIINTFKEKLQQGKNSIIEQWIGNELDGLSPKMISDAYDLGDSLAYEVINETAEILGFGLANVVNIFNPEMIILGGGVSLAGDKLLEPARHIMKKHALKVSSNACTLVQAKLGDSAGMIGAAVYASDRML